jgi:hypothetical protein
MDAIKSQPATPRPKRRWFQYSLRSLMLFVLCCAIACSWFATRAANQREAVRALLGIHGCLVAYDCDYCDFADPFISPAAFGDVLPVKSREMWTDGLFGKDFGHRVVEVGVPLAEVTEAMPHLARLPHLKTVYIIRGTGENGDAAETRLARDLPKGVVQEVKVGPACDEATESIARAASWIGVLVALW